MTSQASAIDLLVKKGRFEPQVAVAIAEAIDTAMSDSQVVTVPILDARLAELRADTRISAQELKSEIVRLEQKIDGTRENLEQKIDGARQNLEQRIDSFRENLDQKVDGTREYLEQKIGSLRENLEQKIDGTRESLEKTMEAVSQRTRADVVRWVLLAMLGSAALSTAGAFVTHAMHP